ncbi:uncharacterized protein LOC117469231 [Trematomus bernacchii]|uniref:uncharacterized protein LOC117469231 n=1 Tax=Trematomus bernacchii TaxID=40690 RepID=UPI001469F256|nr:uncharacterized protein LOC117469231 [Trematomus bernacchii]
MVSTLDIDEPAERVAEEEDEDEEEEGGLQRKMAKLQAAMVDRNEEIELLQQYNRKLYNKYKNQEQSFNRTMLQARMLGADQLEGCSPQQTSQAGSSSRTTGIKLRKLPFPGHVKVLNNLLEEFRKLQTGPRPTPKRLNNVESKMSRVNHFVAWMSQGMRRLSKLKFLGQLDRLQGVGFLRETPPRSSSITKEDLFKVIRELTSSIKSWDRPLALHAMRVKEKKEATLHSVEELCE